MIFAHYPRTSLHESVIGPSGSDSCDTRHAIGKESFRSCSLMENALEPTFCLRTPITKRGVQGACVSED